MGGEGRRELGKSLGTEAATKRELYAICVHSEKHNWAQYIQLMAVLKKLWVYVLENRHMRML